MRVVTYAAKDKVKDETAITGMMFEPLGELQPIPPSQDESFARQHYHPACEAALNDQINVRAPPVPSIIPLLSWLAKGRGLPCDSVSRGSPACERDGRDLGFGLLNRPGRRGFR